MGPSFEQLRSSLCGYQLKDVTYRMSIKYVDMNFLNMTVLGHTKVPMSGAVVGSHSHTQLVSGVGSDRSSWGIVTTEAEGVKCQLTKKINVKISPVDQQIEMSSRVKIWNQIKTIFTDVFKENISVQFNRATGEEIRMSRLSFCLKSAKQQKEGVFEAPHCVGILYASACNCLCVFGLFHWQRSTRHLQGNQSVIQAARPAGPCFTYWPPPPFHHVYYHHFIFHFCTIFSSTIPLICGHISSSSSFCCLSPFPLKPNALLLHRNLWLTSLYPCLPLCWPTCLI